MAQDKKAQWIASKAHDVTLPSSFKVKIVIPNLPALIKAGQVPNSLVDVAIKAQNAAENITRELITEQADFANYLVSITVTDPSVTADEVPELPYEDVEMLVEFATRQRDIDAVYHHIGGLETQETWRKFRGLAGLESVGVGS